MKKLALWIVLLGSWIVGGNLSVSAQSLTPEQTREDLNYLKRKLEQLHPGLGYYTPKKRMEQLYDSLYNSLTAPMEYLDFFHKTAPLINSLKDGHTNLNHRKNYIGRETRYVPFYIRQSNRHYYVTHNMSSDTSFRRGTELLSINGRSLSDIHQELMNSDRSGSDGDNQTGRQQWSMVQFADYYAAWFGSADTLTITYRRSQDTLTRQARVPGVTIDLFRHALSRRYRNERDNLPNLSVRILDTLSQTAVLRVSTFMGPKKHDPLQLAFNRQLKKAFQTIQDNGIQNLVVDLQNNGGGVVLNSARLLQYWMPASFTIMAREQLKKDARRELVSRWNLFSALQFHFSYKPDGSGGFASRSHRRRFRPRKQLAFRGNLYFLMNGASFSASTSVLAKTLDAGMGTYVGEASGGAYWGDFAGHFKMITLPNSHIQVRIPLKKLTHAVEQEHGNGFNVEPDFEVARSYQDILRNNNYVLDYTLRLIREGITARRSTVSRPLQAAR